MPSFTESEIEILALDELRGTGFFYVPGPSIAPDAETSQHSRVAAPQSPFNSPERRATYEDVVLVDTLERAINRLKLAIVRDM